MMYVSITLLSDSNGPVMAVDGKGAVLPAHLSHHAGWERRPPNLAAAT
jgi:hypothetical protein